MVLKRHARLKTIGEQRQEHCELCHSTLSIWAEPLPSNDPLPQRAAAHGAKMFKQLSVFFAQQMLAFAQGGRVQIKPSR